MVHPQPSSKSAALKDHHVARHALYDNEKKHGEGRGNWGSDHDQVDEGFVEVKRGVEHAQVQDKKVQVLSKEAFDKLKSNV